MVRAWSAWLLWLRCLYLLPALLASATRHPHARAISRLNRWAGWTGIGWALALGWASR